MRVRPDERDLAPRAQIVRSVSLGFGGGHQLWAFVCNILRGKLGLGTCIRGAAGLCGLCGRVYLPDNASFCRRKAESTASGSSIRSRRFPVLAVII